jgi:hypothetical protein
MKIQEFYLEASELKVVFHNNYIVLRHNSGIDITVYNDEIKRINKTLNKNTREKYKKS